MYLRNLVCPFLLRVSLHTLICACTCACACACVCVCQAPSGSVDQNATGTLDVDTERDRDAEALHQKQLAITRELESRGLIDDQVYRGQAGYTKFVKKQDDEHGAKYRCVMGTSHRHTE
jgi:hypothetical protein